jgi:hypothetical protein
VPDARHVCELSHSSYFRDVAFCRAARPIPALTYQAGNNNACCGGRVSCWHAAFGRAEAAVTCPLSKEMSGPRSNSPLGLLLIPFRTSASGTAMKLVLGSPLSKYSFDRMQYRISRFGADMKVIA